MRLAGNNIAISRIALAVGAILIAFSVGFYFAGAMSRSEKAAELLVSIFSILTSVMLAAMTLSADFRHTTEQTIDLIDFRNRLNALTRLILLFMVYIGVLVCAFIALLAKDFYPVEVNGTLLGLATFALIMSVKMPFDIYRNLSSRCPPFPGEK